MSDKNLSVEDIIKEIKGSTPDLSAQDGYDAQQIVKEVLGRTTQLQTLPIQTEKVVPVQHEVVSKESHTQEVEESPLEQHTGVVPEKEIQQELTSEAVVEQATTAVEEQATLENHIQQTQQVATPIEEEVLVDITGEVGKSQAPKLSDVQLRYISLRKNRKQKMQEFVLQQDEDYPTPPELELDDDVLLDDFEDEGAVPQAENSRRYKKQVLHRVQQMRAAARQKIAIVGGAFVLSLFFAILALLPTAPGFFNLENGAAIYIVLQLSMLVVGTIGSLQFLKKSLQSLFDAKLTIDILYPINVLICLLSGLFYLVFPTEMQTGTADLYVPLCLLLLLSAAAGEWLIAERMFLNYPTAMGIQDSYSVCITTDERLVQKLTKNSDQPEGTQLVYNTKIKGVTGFIEESLPDRLTYQVSGKLTLILLICAAVAALLAGLIGASPMVSLTAVQAVLLLGTSVVPALLCNFPLYYTATKLTHQGGAVLGSEAITRFQDSNTVLINANSMFKSSHVTLYGIKSFSGETIDQTILDAACILSASNSILGEVFSNIVDSNNDHLEKVENVLYEDGMGISAWVGENRVLVGSRELMIHHNISVPAMGYEDKYLAAQRHLLYLAINGELSAVFVIGLECSEEIRAMMETLYTSGITAVVKTVDPIITEDLLSKVFDLPEDAFQVISSRLHKEVDRLSISDKPMSAMVCNDGELDAYLQSFLAAKGLQRNIHYGKLLYLFFAILGVFLVLVFSAMNGLGQLNVLLLSIYQLIAVAACYGLQRVLK